MSKVVFMQGNKQGLPALGYDKGTLYFVNDTQELYKSVGDGVPLAKMSDVIVTNVLPETNILENKIYVKTGADGVSLHVYVNSEWQSITGGAAGSGAEIVEALPSENIDSSKIYIKVAEGDTGVYVFVDGAWVAVAASGESDRDVIIVSELPTTGILSDKVYVLVEGNKINMFIYDNGWKSLEVSGGSGIEVVETLPTQDLELNDLYIKNDVEGAGLYLWNNEWITIATSKSIEIIDERVDILFNLKNKKDKLTYDAEGNISKLETTGEVEEEINYMYDDRGNITRETILRQGHRIRNTFKYDSEDNIIEVDTRVFKL